MKIKSIVLLAVAVGCGLVAMVGVQQVLSQDKKEEGDTVPVMVAVTDIMPGVPLDETNTRFKDWPKDQAPEGAVTDPKHSEERSLRVAAVANEIIMRAKLGERGVFGGSSEIPEGMRVATVQVNLTKTHSGLILPGDRVDVVVTYKTRVPGRGNITKTKTVLEYIKVFSTDNVRQSAVSTADTTEINAKNISLLVTPEQYNLLMLAENKGMITLALRNGGDDAITNAPEVDELMFEDVASGVGLEDVDYGSSGGEDAEMAVNTGDVRQFLATEDGEFEDNNDAEEYEIAEVPTWTIRIYDGDEYREEEIELPPEQTEQFNEETTADPKKKSMKNWLRSMLSGA